MKNWSSSWNFAKQNSNILLTKVNICLPSWVMTFILFCDVISFLFCAVFLWVYTSLPFLYMLSCSLLFLFHLSLILSVLTASDLCIPWYLMYYRNFVSTLLIPWVPATTTKKKTSPKSLKHVQHVFQLEVKWWTVVDGRSWEANMLKMLKVCFTAVEIMKPCSPPSYPTIILPE